jgi:hypothetical protein
MRFRDEGWKIVVILLKPRPGGQADPLKGLGGQRAGLALALLGKEQRPPVRVDPSRRGRTGHRLAADLRAGDTAACSAGVLAWCTAQEAATGSLSPGHEREVPGHDLRAGQQVLSPGLAGRRPGVCGRGGLRVMAFCQRRRTWRKSENGGGDQRGVQGQFAGAKANGCVHAGVLGLWPGGRLAGRRRGGARSGDRAGGKRTAMGGQLALPIGCWPLAVFR